MLIGVSQSEEILHFPNSSTHDVLLLRLDSFPMLRFPPAVPLLFLPNLLSEAFETPHPSIQVQQMLHFLLPDEVPPPSCHVYTHFFSLSTELCILNMFRLLLLNKLSALSSRFLSPFLQDGAISHPYILPAEEQAHRFPLPVSDFAEVPLRKTG